ncbi:MAG: MBL fold metallo-hydrolase, partial [Oscillospiraceae bacterium]
MARFCPLFSGSSGNSIFLGTSESGVLVDVGMNAKQTTLALERVGIDPYSVKAIFITHEHSDHISGLRVFASKYGTQVYTSRGTLDALEEMGMINGKFFAGEVASGVEVDGMRITS